MAPLDSPPDVRTVLVPAAADIHARTASLATPAGSVPCKMQKACLALKATQSPFGFQGCGLDTQDAFLGTQLIASHQLQQVSIILQL